MRQEVFEHIGILCASFCLENLSDSRIYIFETAMEPKDHKPVL